MKVLPQYSDPEHVQDRQPYRLRIEGKDGQAIEITEQAEGGFCVASGNSVLSTLNISPRSSSVFILRVVR